MKKKYNLVYGVSFVLINILAKFLVFGNKEIWFNNMPGPGRNFYYGFKDFLQLSIPNLIPFIIIGGVVTILFELILYRKNIFNKKSDAIIPIIIFIITDIVLLYLFISQCKICV